MDSLIQTINKLQDVFSVIGEHKIDLPQIVVVGSQSSGKSSVLESLVGGAFLPRGTGIVTRAPLILQMIKYNDEQRKEMLKITKNSPIREWATFLHLPNQVFSSLDDVRREIEKKTNDLAGSKKNITHDAITLKIYTQLYNLTFVDLPGITKIPIDDQPVDIDEQIQKLIFKYVEMPNSIILAVVTANTDPSTSESLKIARQVDPQGDRTIAVVTKLDLIDKGTIDDTKDLLCGRKIPVKLGIIGVVNRSQKDINDNKTMEQTRQSETDFLRINYPDIYKKHGNKELANTLQKILINHIKKTYPVLQKSLQDTKIKLEEELQALKAPDHKIPFILNLLKDIATSYIKTINGDQNDISDHIIMGGAHITKIINDEYIEKLNIIDPLVDLTNEHIKIIILNAAGTSKSSFVNEKALKKMVSRQLSHLIEPSLSCVDLVRVEMSKIFDCIDENTLETLKRFPKINTDVRCLLNKMLDNNLTSIKDFIKTYMNAQQTCLNTSNPDFIFDMFKSSPDTQDTIVTNCARNCTSMNYVWNEEIVKKLLKQTLSGLNDWDKTMEISKQVQVHTNLTKCYFEFIRKHVRDFVPKLIQDKMVNAVLNEFEKYLHEYVFTPYIEKNYINDVLAEKESMMKERQQVKQLLDAVNKALSNMLDLQCT